jgi:ribonuclease P protein component
MSDTTFPREVRLRRTDEFAKVRKHGQRSRSGSLLLSFAEGSSKRLGVILTRRIGNAVTRNRVRRVIREFFRVNRESFPAGDCVVIPQAGTAHASNDELRDFLRKGLAKLKERKR